MTSHDGDHTQLKLRVFRGIKERGCEVVVQRGKKRGSSDLESY